MIHIARNEVRNEEVAVPSIDCCSGVARSGVIKSLRSSQKGATVGYLGTGSRSSVVVEAFQQELRDLGYIEGQNITIEYRSTEGMAERLPNVAAELVQLNVDIIVVSGDASTQAAKNATKTIPIVMTNVTDPVGIGLVASLAHPGGNVTGLSNVGSDLGGKQLELLKEASPKVSRVAVLWDSANPGNALWLER
jgi:putative ABC transport system substrate-binding protein